MAAAHYTIAIAVVGRWWRGGRAIVAFVFDHDSGVIHLAFGE